MLSSHSIAITDTDFKAQQKCKRTTITLNNLLIFFDRVYEKKCKQLNRFYKQELIILYNQLINRNLTNKNKGGLKGQVKAESRQ